MPNIASVLAASVGTAAIASIPRLFGPTFLKAVVAYITPAIWIAASVMPQMVRKAKKPNITVTDLPTRGVGNKRARNGVRQSAMAVRTDFIIGIH